MKLLVQQLDIIALFFVLLIFSLTAGFAAGIDNETVFAATEKTTEQAILAGGCFWCMEADYEKISGVKEVISGYAGGTGKSPSYQDYAEKGHIEAVRIIYDPTVLSYKKILDLFWVRIDPTDAGGQFCDRGYEYSSAIFYLNEEQKQFAEQSKNKLQQAELLEKPVATKIVKAGEFYPAEEYHQQYYKKNPLKYKFYRFNCGRDRRLSELWEDAKDVEEAINNISLR